MGHTYSLLDEDPNLIIDVPSKKPGNKKCIILFLENNRNTIYEHLRSENYITILVDTLNQYKMITRKLKLKPQNIILIADHYSLYEIFAFAVRTKFSGQLIIIENDTINNKHNQCTTLHLPNDSILCKIDFLYINKTESFTRYINAAYHNTTKVEITPRPFFSITSLLHVLKFSVDSYLSIK